MSRQDEGTAVRRRDGRVPRGLVRHARLAARDDVHRRDPRADVGSCSPSRPRPSRTRRVRAPPSWRRSTSRPCSSLMAVPIGVATAIYLEEYAHKERWYNRLLELNIQNLAAVPAIVYGILGLAFVVRGPFGIGRVLLAGAIILTLVVLPTVIISSREAIRAVPESISQGGLALGATKWQVIWRQCSPRRSRGSRPGSILALSRAVGETAPLLLIGALSTSPSTRPSSAPSPRFPCRSTRGSSFPTRSSRRSRRLRSSCCWRSC